MVLEEGESAMRAAGDFQQGICDVYDYGEQLVRKSVKVRSKVDEVLSERSPIIVESFCLALADLRDSIQRLLNSLTFSYRALLEAQKAAVANWREIESELPKLLKLGEALLIVSRKVSTASDQVLMTLKEGTSDHVAMRLNGDLSKPRSVVTLVENPSDQVEDPCPTQSPKYEPPHNDKQLPQYIPAKDIVPREGMDLKKDAQMVRVEMVTSNGVSNLYQWSTTCHVGNRWGNGRHAMFHLIKRTCPKL